MPPIYFAAKNQLLVAGKLAFEYTESGALKAMGQFRRRVLVCPAADFKFLKSINEIS